MQQITNYLRETHGRDTKTEHFLADTYDQRQHSELCKTPLIIVYT